MTVKQIQQRLKDLGYDPGPIDGINGPKTKAAVQKFQTDNGLTADGVVGPLTTSALEGAKADGKKATTAKSGSPDDVREFLLQNFPSYAWAVDHAEIGPILAKAAKEEWDSVRLRGAIEGTDWWQSTSATARQAKLLQENDPEEWQRQHSAKMAEIKAISQDMGVRVTDAQLRSLAKDALTIGFNPAQLQQAVLDNSNYARITLEQIERGEVGGAIAQVESAIEQTVDQWMLGMPPGVKMRWIRDVAEGRKNIDQLKNYATTMAKKNMPYIADLIDQGLTAREAIEPYQQTVADVLERDPSDVDLFDERFRRSIVDDEGKLRSMPQTKAAARKQFFDEWNTTSTAQQSATGLVGEIATMFGRRA